MIKRRGSVLWAVVLLSACADTPAELSPPPRLFGNVRTVFGPVPDFILVYERTEDVACAGPALVSDTSRFTNDNGGYEIDMPTGAAGMCTRLVFTAVARPELLPDTVRGINLTRDTARLDVVLASRPDTFARRRAVLAPGWVPIEVLVPDTVTRGVPFDVAIAHYGSGSCTTTEPVEVSRHANTAILSPYIIERLTGGCTADLHKFVLTGQVSFPDPGPATILVIGRDTTVARTTFVR